MIKLTTVYDVAIIVYPNNVVGLIFKDPPFNGSIRMELNLLKSYSGISVYKNSEYDAEHFTDEAKQVLDELLDNCENEDNYLKEWTIELSPIYEVSELVDGLVEMFTKYNLKSVIRYYEQDNDDEEQYPMLV